MSEEGCTASTSSCPLSLLVQVVKQHFKEDFVSVFRHLSSGGGNPTEDDMRSLLFGDYMKLDTVSSWNGQLTVSFRPSF